MLRARKVAPLFVGVFVALATFRTVPVGADSPAGKAVVTVQGIACPFCAYGLEKHLEKLDGVSDVQVDVGKAEATLELEDVSLPSDEMIRQAVRRSGFTPGEIRRRQMATVSEEAERAARAEFHVEGMRCPYCVANIGSILERREGVISADVDLESKRVIVEYDPEKITPEAIAETIERAGTFEASVVSGRVPERSAE